MPWREPACLGLSWAAAQARSLSLFSRGLAPWTQCCRAERALESVPTVHWPFQGECFALGLTQAPALLLKGQYLFSKLISRFSLLARLPSVSLTPFFPSPSLPSLYKHQEFIVHATSTALHKLSLYSSYFYVGTGWGNEEEEGDGYLGVHSIRLWCLDFKLTDISQWCRKDRKLRLKPKEKIKL